MISHTLGNHKRNHNIKRFWRYLANIDFLSFSWWRAKKGHQFWLICSVSLHSQVHGCLLVVVVRSFVRHTSRWGNRQSLSSFPTHSWKGSIKECCHVCLRLPRISKIRSFLFKISAEGHATNRRCVITATYIRALVSVYSFIALPKGSAHQHKLATFR